MIRLLVLDVDGTLTDGGIYCLPVGDTDYGTYYADGMLYINERC